MGDDRGSAATRALDPGQRMVATTKTPQRRCRPTVSSSGNAMQRTRPTGVLSAEARMSMLEDPELLKKRGVGAFIQRFTQEHNVSGERTRLNDWAAAVSRAAGDHVRLVHVERLLVALKKQHLINGLQAARMLINYRREAKFDERPAMPDDHP